MFYGMELAPAKLWWDLFCSKECCKEIHSDETPEYFRTANDFQNRTGVELKDKSCFNCGKTLEIKNV